MQPYEVKSFTISDDVESAEAVTIAYPDGTTASTFDDAGDHAVYSMAYGEMTVAGGDITMTFGASNITITNTSSVTWAAQTRFHAQMIRDLSDDTLSWENLGLGSLARHDDDDVKITGGEITGVTFEGGVTSAALSESLALHFLTVAILVADETLGYAEGGSVTSVVAASDKVYAENFTYVVAASGATDYHLQTAGGVKLYVTPNDRQAIFTSQLGWVENTDVADQITRLFDNWPSGATTLRQDGDYELTGAGYDIPSAMKAWLTDDYETLSHGEQAARAILLKDYSTVSAAANGISANLLIRFNAPSGFKVGGLRIDDNVEVDASTLVNGGNGQAIFDCSDQAICMTVDACRFDQKGGIAVEFQRSPYWRFTRVYAGQQKYLLNITGGCHWGVYDEVRGEMGFQLSGGQFHGDYIKTSPDEKIGPRFCTVKNSRFVNVFRDGPDGTGGFHGWLFFNNDFDVATAAIDVKLAYNGDAGDDRRERQYKGIMFINNRCYGCGIIITDTFQEDEVGAPYDPDIMIQQFYAQGNQFFPVPGRSGNGYFLKSSRGGFLSIGDTFHSFTGVNAGTWDASSGAFPADAVKHTYYTVSSGGTVDGETFTSGEIVYALVDDAATDTYEDNWFNTGNEFPRINALNPIKLTNDGVGVHMNSQGNWDASSGSFPSGGVPGDYWTVSVAGTVDGVEFKVGHYIVPLVSSASTTTYNGQWERRIGDPGPSENVQFRELTWDARGGAIMQITTVSDFRVHFADLQTDGASTITINHCENVHISGRVRGYQRPTGESGVIDLISISGSDPSRDIYVDVDYRHKTGDGSKGSIIRVAGVVEGLWLDGKIVGAAELTDIAGTNSVTDFYFGKRTSLEVRNLSTRLITKASGATANGLWWGRVYTDEGVSLWNNEPSLHDIGRLQQGHGKERTISGGSIRASYTHHRIDTQSDASTDDLDNITGGAVGDILTISAADSARTVVVKTGTGNIVLGLTAGDVNLDNAVDTLTLIKRADGNWHELVTFASLGA